MDIFRGEYRYNPLRGSQIRLLRLLPGPRNTELEGSLDIRDLTVRNSSTALLAPDYEALSYYWGEKDTKNPDGLYIKLLESNQSYRKFIRPNLESALRQLRSPNYDRYLWVDALCIDQASKEEKNVQIPRMHEIYNKAKCVCIWLGEERDNSDNAMAFVKRLLDLDAFGRMQSPEEARQWVDFATLLRRPWFNRRWIVQELAVARAARLYCGKRELDWREFADAISLFASKHVDLKGMFKASAAFGFNPNYLGDVKELGAYQLVHVASNFFRKSGKGDILEPLLSLEEIVSRLSSFDASDGRDVIYAVLSLSSDATPRTKSKSEFAYNKLDLDKAVDEHFNQSRPSSPIAPSRPRSITNELTRVTSNDGKPSWRTRMFIELGMQGFLRPFTEKTITIHYEKPVFEVYKDFLEFAITRSESLDIICRPWAANAEGLPSWIPRKIGATHGLRQNRAYTRVRADPLVSSTRGGGKNYFASGTSKAQWMYRDHEVLTRSLIAKGFILDSIDVKLNPAIGGIIPAEWCDLENKTRLEVQDSFWRTLVADRGPEGQKPPPSYYELACKYAFGQSSDHGYLDSRELMMEDCPPMVKEFLERVQSVVWMRRLIQSRNKRLLGLVPYGTKKRDLICILLGCSVPVILREHVAPNAADRKTGISITKAESKAESEAEAETATGSIPIKGDGRRSSFLEPPLARQSAMKAATSMDTVSSPPPSRTSGNAQAVGVQNSVASTPLDGTAASRAADGSGADKESPLQLTTIESATTDELESHSEGHAATVSPTTQESSAQESPQPNQARTNQHESKARVGNNDKGQKNASTEDEVTQIKKDDRAESWETEVPDVYYEFIGECYIHGMMDGEAMQLVSQDPAYSYRRVKFWLR